MRPEKQGAVTVPAFRYEGLDEPAQAELEQLATVIVDTTERTCRANVEALMQIGKALAEAHDLLAGKGREGMFGPWIDRCCNISRSSAYKAKDVYMAFNKCPHVDTFEMQALYLLSAPSCPEAATKDALKLAKKGEKLTAKMARQIIAEHTPEEPKAPVAFSVAAVQIRKTVEKAKEQMTDDGRRCLQPFLSSLAMEFADAGSTDEPAEDRAKPYPKMLPETPKQSLLHKLANLCIKCLDSGHKIDASGITHFYFPTNLCEQFDRDMHGDGDESGVDMDPVGTDTPRLSALATTSESDDAQMSVITEPVTAEATEPTATTTDTPSEDAAMSLAMQATDNMVTINGERFEVQRLRRQWEFRRSPSAGWTVASDELAQMIEAQTAAPAAGEVHGNA